MNAEESLCYNDPRNPNYIALDDDDQRVARVDCYCDNCFYGRDTLAVRLLELESKLADALDRPEFVLHQMWQDAEAKLAERCKLDGHVDTIYSLDGKPTVGEHNGTEIVKCRYCGIGQAIKGDK